MDKTSVKLIGYILIGLHMIISLFPFFMFLISKKVIGKYFKWIFLFYILIPMHWFFFNNRCLLTILHDKIIPNDSEYFTDSYFGGVIKFVFNIFNIEKNEVTTDKCIDFISYINILLIWFYLYYKKE